MTIHNHYIIKVIRDIYIDFPGGTYHDHFIEKPLYLRVKTEPTNNGNFTAVDKKGRLYHYNTIDKNIVEAIPA